VTRSEAANALAVNPNPHARAVFKTRDATGDWWVSVPCWLDAGELVMAHPTDAGHWPIGAPADAHYTIEEPTADELAWREEQAALGLAARDLKIYRDEFGDDPPDAAWFTTAFEYARDPGCDWSTYWSTVQRLA
jgi:hypothetical protein